MRSGAFQLRARQNYQLHLRWERARESPAHMAIRRRSHGHRRLCDPSEITPRPRVADMTLVTSPKLTGLAAVAWASSPRSHGSRSRACTGLPWCVSETRRALHDRLPDLQRITPDPQVTEAGVMDSTALAGTIAAISATPYGHHGACR